MPVYNEEETVSDSVRSWMKELESLDINFEVHAYNDGSADNTLSVLNSLTDIYPNLVVHNKPNTGHGPTILAAYRQHSDKDWIFQTDSDNEMDPSAFKHLWFKKDDYDFLLGARSGRDQAISRAIVSLFSRFIVRVFYGRGIYDVNSPYRLMKTSSLKDIYYKIPDNTFAPNVIISGVVNARKLEFLEIPVMHQNRQSGTVSINKFKLIKAALKSFWQTSVFVFSHHL